MNILKKIQNLEEEASHFGFAWPDSHCILKQLTDECAEIKEAIDANEKSARVQEEIGDLLHAAFSLCVFMGFDPQETLEKTTDKFAQRFDKLKTIARVEGYENLRGESFETLMKLWAKAKK